MNRSCRVECSCATRTSGKSGWVEYSGEPEPRRQQLVCKMTAVVMHSIDVAEVF